MYYYMAQTQEIKELLEFVAQQQLTTQLIAVIILLLLVFGFIGVMMLRGGLKVFSDLSNSIKSLADVDKKAQETQQDLVDAVQHFSKQNEDRYKRVDEIWHDVMEKVNILADKVIELDQKLEKTYSAIEKTPSDYQILTNLITEINHKLDDIKQKTDEIEAVHE